MLVTVVAVYSAVLVALGRLLRFPRLRLQRGKEIEAINTLGKAIISITGLAFFALNK